MPLSDAITGQDTVRGTFSQRHQTLVDAKNGEAWTPMQHLTGARASFEIHNSPLSEDACLGFEYGYAVAMPAALVLWEAQFGALGNGAEGEPYVPFPSRAFGGGPEPRSFDSRRSIEGTPAEGRRVKAWIVEEWRASANAAA